MTWLVGNAAREHFEIYPSEASFMKYLGDVFQVTHANRLTTGNSEYSYYFLKPYPRPSQRYGLGGEVVALYSPYPELQARSLVDTAEIQQKYKERVHPVWNILISDDPNVVKQLSELTAGKDLEVYSIPFSREELEQKPNADYINKRLEKFIHGRDLFAFQSALQSDIFFFGRKTLVDNIIAQTENGQNFGLFGLRKIGKTSVLLAVERYIKKSGSYKTIHIDCQNPGIYLMRWNSLIAKICHELGYQSNNHILSFPDQIAQLERIVNNQKQKVLLVFDEVENISFGDLSPAKHWNEDFLPFWGAIRAIHQQTHGRLSFGVAGVNPFIFDIPLVAGKDNPILLGVSPLYLSPLDEETVREMVRTIGRYMGLTFEEDVYKWLFHQFGGHPFLVRKACSLIYRKSGRISGDTVTLNDFTSRQSWLDEKLGTDILNILVVLAQHYPDEFDNLLLLAKGDYEWIKEIGEAEPSTLRHILEYGIVCDDDGNLEFVIDTLKRFLAINGERMKTAVSVLTKSSQPTNYSQLPNPSQLDLWIRVGKARNTIEPRLRILIHRALSLKYGERKALQMVLEKFSTEKQKTLIGYSLSQIFTGESKALFLKDLKEIILREWELFQHVFANDRKRFEARMDLLNTDGRADAHANPISEKDVLQIEATASNLLEQMVPYLGE